VNTILREKVGLIRCFYCEVVIPKNKPVHMLAGWVECNDCHEYRLEITAS
jgi:ribosomal protein S26